MASGQEVWSKDGSFSGREKSYLQAQTYGDFAPPQTEEEWLAFWQDWKKQGYDMNSPWYRWKVYFSCGQLTEILQKTLAESANCRIEGNQNDLGRLTGIAVTRRGQGGLAMELQLTFEKGMATVKTENAIRKVLSPTKRTLGEPIYLQRKGAEAMTGNAMLPSGFFAVKEMKNAEGKLTGVALYGGGNGHGVGLSQYGAKYLAEHAIFRGRRWKGCYKERGLDFLSEKIRSGLKTVPFLKKKCAIIGQMAERKCFYGYG